MKWSETGLVFTSECVDTFEITAPKVKRLWRDTGKGVPSKEEIANYLRKNASHEEIFRFFCDYYKIPYQSREEFGNHGQYMFYLAYQLIQRGILVAEKVPDVYQGFFYVPDRLSSIDENLARQIYPYLEIFEKFSKFTIVSFKGEEAIKQGQYQKHSFEELTKMIRRKAEIEEEEEFKFYR